MLERLFRSAIGYFEDKMLQITIGAFIAGEGVLALLWFGNNKWLLAQMLRLLRVLSGIVLILVGLRLEL